MYNKIKEKIREKKEKTLKEQEEKIRKFQEEESEKKDKAGKVEVKSKVEEEMKTDEGPVLATLEKIDSFLCPISQELMTDPVLSPYGHCYQREHIEAWLDKKEVCPLTGRPLKKSQLVPCITLRNIVAEMQSGM